MQDTISRVIIRVDASVDIGTGHVMRCLALADAWRECDVDVTFVCRDLPGNLINRVESAGFSVNVLPLAHEYRQPQGREDYAGWLQVSEQEDAAAVAQFVDARTFVVTDHYGLGQAWEEALSKSCAGVLAIDDLCRMHGSAYVVDHTAGRDAADYGAVDCVMTGSPYALLRTEYNRLRETLDGAREAQPARLLVSLGGADADNTTGNVVDVLAALSQSFERIDVVLPATAPHHRAVSEQINALGSPFILHDFVEDFARMLMGATLAIGAPGTTTWERAAVGLPAVLVPIAENQRGVATAMRNCRAAVIVEQSQLAADLGAALDELVADYGGFVARNLQITDGLGCRRVVARVLAPATPDGRDIWLRKATSDDIRQIYEWQQLPETRRYARNPEPPEWSGHQAWMQARLADPGCYFYLVMAGSEPAGMVRLDRQAPGAYEVSIFVAPELHGQGIGLDSLRLLGDLHRDVTIHATVLAGNEASHRLFTGAGYVRESDTEYVLHRKTA